MGDIHALQVQPKTLNKRYKSRTYTITFVPGNPAAQRWHWEVVEVVTTRYGGDAPTTNAAQKAAEKYIDKVVAIKGT